MMAKETQGETMPTKFRAMSAMESSNTHRASRAEQSEFRLVSGLDTAVVPLPGTQHVQDRFIAHPATHDYKKELPIPRPAAPEVYVKGPTCEWWRRGDETLWSRAGKEIFSTEVQPLWRCQGGDSGCDSPVLRVQGGCVPRNHGL